MYARKLQLSKICESIEETTDTYSSVMRRLNKEKSKDLKSFMGKFKNAFDEEMDKNNEDHQNSALLKAKAIFNLRFVKLAELLVFSSGSPEEVGKTVAYIVKVILSRFPRDDRISIENIKEKILNLNVSEISNTHLPNTASYGQALTLIKTLLNGYNPEFVKKVLIATVNNL